MTSDAPATGFMMFLRDSSLISIVITGGGQQGCLATVPIESDTALVPSEPSRSANEGSPQDGLSCNLNKTGAIEQ